MRNSLNTRLHFFIMTDLETSCSYAFSNFNRIFLSSISYLCFQTKSSWPSRCFGFSLNYINSINLKQELLVLSSVQWYLWCLNRDFLCRMRAIYHKQNIYQRMCVSSQIWNLSINLDHLQYLPHLFSLYLAMNLFSLQRKQKQL